MNQPRKVAILGGNRIPFARSNKEYAKASNQDMLTSALNGLVARYGLQDQEMGLVVGGAVLKHARDFNLVRESVLGSELASTTPAFDLQHACGTSLTSAIQVADAIALGRIENGIACGADTTSDAPLAVNDTLRKTLIRLSNAKSVKDQLKLAGSIRPNQLAPEQPQNGEPRTGLSMGDHAAITAREMEISREEQDELAATSHQNLAKAYEENFFDDLMTPFLGVNRDTNLRPDSTVEKLSKLKPVFGKKDAEQHGGTATMTAGNSTPLTDGAAAVLLSSEEWAKEQNLPVRAYLVDSELAAVDFVSGKDGLLMADLRRAAPARAQRTDPAGLRLLRDPRGIRFPGARHPQGMGGRDLLPRAPRPGCPAGFHRPLQAQRQGLFAGSRPPVRGDRRTHPRFRSEDPRGKRRRPHPHLHLCRRWPGRRRDHRALNITYPPPHKGSIFRKEGHHDFR